MIEEIERKSRRGVARQPTNPFVAVLRTKMRADNAQFVKLYTNGMRAFRDLTSAGSKVFELIYLEVQRNIGKDILWLSFGEVDQAATPMGKATFMRGMRELIEKGFLAESTTQSKYYLNPDYIWNGDRLAFVKEYYKAPSQPALPPEETEEGLP